jgi:hypothetical protein
MKSERRSIPCSAQAFHRRIPGNGSSTLVESKCLACGQVVDTLLNQSLERDENAFASPQPMERSGGKVARKRPPNAIHLEKLLHFSQQLYAHALTLQEVIRNEGEVRYAVLRPRYDRQAAQQFEIFYHTLKRQPEFRKRGAGACE